MSAQYWQVAVDAPIDEPLTYIATESMNTSLRRGLSVQVPLGKRNAIGILLNPISEKPNFEVKPIEAILPENLPLPNFFLKWLEWLSQYYFHPIGSVCALAFPPLKKTETPRKSKKAPIVKAIIPDIPPALTAEQSKVVTDILNHSGFLTHLVFGVTGSGKTEIYMRLLDAVLKQGKRGLVLVPEISLTPQLVQRFAARFGEQIAVIHSHLTEREKTNQWWDVVEEKKNILIGARSALFCPIENLGLIIVDEEHEASFKQEEKLKYNGRDAAIMLAKFSECPVVLGSATPSLESWKNAAEGKYHLHRLKSRVEMRALPDIQIVDMRQTTEEKKLTNKYPTNPSWLSDELFEAIKKSLVNKQQIALFLNRRGVSPLVICNACGFIHECPNCDISLTLHGKTHLVCHYCDYHETFSEHCPDCKEGELSPVGLGTELLEQEMRRLFPEASIARADRDEITSRTDLEELVEKMESHKIDILIGTQMIAKGLDFKKLNLVGLILADIGFNIPDFRSTERSFQLITQVSGRAGRHVQEGEEPGQVIIQTYNPEHPSLIYAKNNLYEQFAEAELQHRKLLMYPPYGKLISVKMQGLDLAKVQACSKQFAARANSLKEKSSSYSDIEILGPAEAPLAKVRGNYRYHLLLKGPDTKNLNKFCRHVLGPGDWISSGVRIMFDIDPLHLL